MIGQVMRRRKRTHRVKEPSQRIYLKKQAQQPTHNKECHDPDPGVSDTHSNLPAEKPLL